MKIFYKKKSINIDVKRVSFLGRFSGLMFKSRENKNLLFEFRKDVNLSIHSFFVFFSFIAVWLDGKNMVIKWKIVKPFTVAVKSKKPFRKLVEIPFNNSNSRILRFFVDKERFK